MKTKTVVLTLARWPALLCCLMPAFAGAQGIPFAAADESMLFREIPMVYGASKYEQKASDAPSSVSIVRAADIRKFGYRSLADVLRSVRGLYVTYDRNYTYLGVRGFGRPGDYNSRILLLVDGHRINDNIYGQAMIGTEFPVDVDLIDRVEVIRGPGSSLYGTGAFFAVINVLTKEARHFNGAELSAEAGNLATAKGRASYGQRFENGLGLMLSATAYRSSGQRDLFYPEFDSPQTHRGIARDLDADRTEQVFADFAFDDFKLRLVHGSRRKEIPTASFGMLFNDPRAHTVDTRQYVDLSYKRSLDAESDVSARVYLDYYRYSGDYPFDLPPVVLNRDTVDGRWWGAEYKYTTHFGDRHHATLGAEYVDNYRQYQKNFYVDPHESFVDSQRRSRSWAVYLQDEFAITPSLTLNAGVRYDALYSLGNTTNPRLALIWGPSPDTTLKLLYGTAFRAPNAYELYYNNTGGIGYKPPGPLEPEKIRSTELVLEQSLTDHVRGVVSAYRNEIENLLNLRSDPDGLLIFGNLDQARSRGLEFELEGQWANGVEGRASYTVQRTTDATTGETLSNSPEHMAKLNVSAPIFQPNLFGALELQYVGSRQTVRNTSLGGFVLANLTLFQRSLQTGMELSASVYNLFDKNYADTGSEEHVQDRIVQDGRTFRVKLTLPF